MNAKERYGIIIKLPIKDKTGIILDTNGEYYDFAYENDSVIYPPTQSSDPKGYLKVGDMVGFKKNKTTVARQIRKVSYF